MPNEINRREFLIAGSLGAAALTSAVPQVHAAPSRSPATSGVMPKAILFDTFGTLVEWRSSIRNEGISWGKEKNIQGVDWDQFAVKWRQGQGQQMARVRKGEIPWTKLDDLHRMILENLLVEFKITGLTEEEKDHWNRVWHRLKPYPDTIAGLTRLKTKFIIAPLSNANFSMMTDLSKNAKIPWDCILSAELARHYKYDKEAYLTSVDLLSLQPGEVIMAAAHSPDLRAARSFGLLTGHITIGPSKMMSLRRAILILSPPTPTTSPLNSACNFLMRRRMIYRSGSIPLLRIAAAA
jgi:2-haloacid dehalogenase